MTLLDTGLEWSWTTSSCKKWPQCHLWRHWRLIYDWFPCSRWIRLPSRTWITKQINCPYIKIVFFCDSMERFQYNNRNMRLEWRKYVLSRPRIRTWKLCLVAWACFSQRWLRKSKLLIWTIFGLNKYFSIYLNFSTAVTPNSGHLNQNGSNKGLFDETSSLITAKVIFRFITNRL